MEAPILEPADEEGFRDPNLPATVCNLDSTEKFLQEVFLGMNASTEDTEAKYYETQNKHCEKNRQDAIGFNKEHTYTYGKLKKRDQKDLADAVQWGTPLSFARS